MNRFTVLKIFQISFLLFAISIFSGCATAPKGAEIVERASQLTPIQEVYSERLRQVSIGMNLQNYLRVFPESYPGGQSGGTTAYELSRKADYVTSYDITMQNILWGVGSPRAKTERQVLWFYFYDGKLIKWGNPGDWPPAPDTIIEVR
jgi:hypothetical protein